MQINSYTTNYHIRITRVEDAQQLIKAHGPIQAEYLTNGMTFAVRVRRLNFLIDKEVLEKLDKKSLAILDKAACTHFYSDRRGA